jgi:hypothetical protein
MNSKKEKRIAKAIKKREKKINDDLFDNSMVRNILKQMTPEQVQEYKEIGKQLYGNIDFEKSEVLANLPPPMAEALAYIKEGIKSGLLPHDLEKDEIVLLKEAYGKEWYKKFGFSEADVVGLPGMEDEPNIIDVKLENKENNVDEVYGPIGTEQFNIRM